jgi:hypothetical protein
VILKPTALQKFHKALVDRKYRLIISSSANRRKPGPKGRSTEPAAAIVEVAHRNPTFGCVRDAHGDPRRTGQGAEMFCRTFLPLCALQTYVAVRLQLLVSESVSSN